MITKFFKPQTPSNTAPSSSLPSSPVPVPSLVNLFRASDNDKGLTNLELKSDPAERKPISEYPTDVRDQVRRYYIQKKACQPSEFDFPVRNFGGIPRNFISLFSSIVHVLGVLQNEGANYHEKALVKSLVEDIRSYEFIYMLHLMLKILAITYDLNMALQRKDQDIVNAMKLVDFAKRQLQSMRESKWNSLLEDISLFCEKNDIVIPEMDEQYGLGKLKRKSSSVTYSHHLRVDIFYVVIDLQLSELNNRFNEVNTDLLLGMSSLSPENSFVNYDKNKIMKLATYYPNEFCASKLEDLRFDLDNYIYYVREVDNAFSNLKGLGDLSMKLVETNMHKTWGLVYLLVKLSLILPVATATVERAFSSMKFIKNDLRSRIGDEFLNDCLVCYIEDEVFESVPNDAIIDRFQNMATRRVQL